MARRARYLTAGYPLHVVNRSSRRVSLFDSPFEYAEFERLLLAGRRKVDVRLFSWCLMPNHWHLFVNAEKQYEVSKYLHWVTGLHAQRRHLECGTGGLGPIYQGRFRSFPVSTDLYFYNVCRYIERNAVRARLCARAEDWRWSSLWWFVHRPAQISLAVDEWLIVRPRNWMQLVSREETNTELERLRASAHRGVPYGNVHSARSDAMRELQLSQLQ
jgi:putative transposase